MNKNRIFSHEQSRKISNDDLKKIAAAGGDGGGSLEGCYNNRMGGDIIADIHVNW